MTIEVIRQDHDKADEIDEAIRLRKKIVLHLIYDLQITDYDQTELIVRHKLREATDKKSEE
jgi:hypothetical protein